MKQALVGMSGGVDSSVAAYLVREAGYETTGVTMRLYDNKTIGIDTSKTCCSLSSIEDACSVANRLGIFFLVYDLREEFKRDVIDNFVSEYEHGRTPNPCVICNSKLKFDAMYKLGMRDLLENRAAGDGASAADEQLYVATGHYAVTERDASGRYILRKAADLSKDQTYFLSTLTQEQLSRTLFPLGGLTKPEVRDIASSLGLVTAAKRESQDICFVPGGDYTSFIRGYTGRNYPAGDFVDTNGTVLGRHTGIINYTVGQRKGLGLALGKPAYVQDIDPERNQVIIGDNETLFTRELTSSDFNWVSMGAAHGDFRADVRIRYRHKEAPAQIVPLAENKIQVIFDTPQRAITRGQTVVLYDGDYVLGGGTID